MTVCGDIGLFGQPPGSFILQPQQQWLIAQQFSKVKEKDDWKLKTVSDLRKLIKPEQWELSSRFETQLVQMLDGSVEKIIDAYQNRDKGKAKGRDNSNEGTQGIGESSALSMTSPHSGSQQLAKDNAVAQATIQNEEDKRNRQKVRRACIGAVKAVPVINDVPVTPIDYRDGSEKRLTSMPQSGRGGNSATGKGRKGNRVDAQSLESDVESPESSETLAVRLRRPSMVTELV